VWNCSSQNVHVLKATGPDMAIVETIPGRSWIASMKGGVQITAISIVDGDRTLILWRQGQTVLTDRVDSADAVCAGRDSGIVVQQF